MQNPSLVLETKYATNKQFYVNEYYFSLLVAHMKGVIFTRVLLLWLAPTFLTKTEHTRIELMKKRFLANLFCKCKIF